MKAVRFPTHDSCGYPLFYIHPEFSHICCAECIEKDVDAGFANESSCVPFVHWEGLPLYCDECNKKIDSAYGSDE